jgi:S-DNA-T family DNA segregation ATPase FtsK/SpoIIIE
MRPIRGGIPSCLLGQRYWSCWRSPSGTACPISPACGGIVDGPPWRRSGATADGPVVIDLVRDGPHALVGGTTGSGKSELLVSLVASLAAANRPEELSFVLVDYKGGAAFGACRDLPHVVGLVTDLDPQLTERALISLDAELKRREADLR